MVLTSNYIKSRHHYSASFSSAAATSRHDAGPTCHSPHACLSRADL